MTSITITHYTDPGCPFAWSAEPARRRLQWLYGDQLEWRLQMVGLTERPEDYIDKGFTPERQSSSFARLAQAYGMPMDTALRPRMAATMPACRAVVAVRRHEPEREALAVVAVRRHEPEREAAMLRAAGSTSRGTCIAAAVDPAGVAELRSRHAKLSVVGLGD